MEDSDYAAMHRALVELRASQETLTARLDAALAAMRATDARLEALLARLEQQGT